MSANTRYKKIIFEAVMKITLDEARNSLSMKQIAQQAEVKSASVEIENSPAKLKHSIEVS